MLNWSPAQQHGDRHHPSDDDHPRESLRGQSLVLRDLQPLYLCNWQQAWDVVRKYFAFWSCEILTLLCILVYCSRSTPAHWVLGLSDQNGRTWPRSGGWFFLKFHNKLFKVMLGKPTVFVVEKKIGWSTQQLRHWEFVIIVFQLKSRWENTLKHNIMLLTCPWPSPSWSPPSWAACTLEIAIFSNANCVTLIMKSFGC